MPGTVSEVADAVGAIGQKWVADRPQRQARRHLDPDDFEQLRDAGLLALIAPVDAGGLWEGTAQSMRPLCEIYRRLASADPSVALVSAMHPAVIAFWLASPAAADQPDWEEQRRAVFSSAVAGHQWGTITSEPGSGGDISRTRAVATPADVEGVLPGRAYAVTGDKHFGSGMGVTDRMVTTAIPDGEDDPTIFVLDVDEKPWDGSCGLHLIAEWDGSGMAATQSHAMRLEDAPATRMAWPGKLDAVSRAASPWIATLFTAVVLGVLDEAVSSARNQARAKADQWRAYERVEWTRAEQDHWLAVQAFDGALRAIESGDADVALHAALRAKQAVADLAEQTLLRLNRVLGGGTFSRKSPFAHWFEDVRALGFLRPPWGLAYDMLFATSVEER
jgi:alkylation response protein AidB-like acyl-CoA dehydrogenase